MKHVRLLMWTWRRTMFNSILTYHFDLILTNKDVALIIYSVTIVHVWCIKIRTWLRGFRVKNANFSWLRCLAIPRRDLSTKKNKSNDHRKMTRKPWSHARILIYQTWAFCDANHQEVSNINCSTFFLSLIFFCLSWPVSSVNYPWFYFPSFWLCWYVKKSIEHYRVIKLEPRMKLNLRSLVSCC